MTPDKRRARKPRRLGPGEAWSLAVPAALLVAFILYRIVFRDGSIIYALPSLAGLATVYVLISRRS